MFRLHRPGRGVWWGDGGATGMHCPTIKSLSPGRACEPGSKQGVSWEGARAADWESA